MSSDPLLASLRSAVEAAPDDVALRVHLAQLLVGIGLFDEAIVDAAGALIHDPGCSAALAVLVKVGTGRVGGTASATDEELLARLDEEFTAAPGPFDRPGEMFRVETSGLRLADVGGMQLVKARLEASFLAPLRNPDLRRVFRSSLHGGLLLYGPPGCGKTMIARALAGELGAGFLSVSLADVLDMYVGQSERNLRELFRCARRNAPCVVFLDEVDAIGQKRSQLGASAARGSVNQLLTEMDGIGEGAVDVFVLAATNHPWDVDVALRRPGRLDRMMLVTPPDEPARQAILASCMAGRPHATLDLAALAGATAGYSGADLAHLCDSATARALVDSARTGSVRPIEMADLTAVLPEVRPSIGPWLDIARNVAQFANESGAYNDLVDYLRARGRW